MPLATAARYEYTGDGNLISKGGLSGATANQGNIGTLTYGNTNRPNGAGPHAVTTANGLNYAYDASGNLTTVSTGAGGTGTVSRQISYTSFNQPIKIIGSNPSINMGAGGTNTPSTTVSTQLYNYDGAHNRIKQITTSGAGGNNPATTTTTYYAPAGLFEKFIRADGNIEYRHTLLSPDGSLGIYTINAYGPTNNAADLPVAAPPFTVPAIAPQQTKYWAKDHLGSPVAEYPHGATSIPQVTQLGYDAWGLRRKAQANNAANNGFVSVSEADIDSYASPRGYTGQSV